MNESHPLPTRVARMHESFGDMSMRSLPGVQMDRVVPEPDADPFLLTPVGTPISTELPIAVQKKEQEEQEWLDQLHTHRRNRKIRDEVRAIDSEDKAKNDELAENEQWVDFIPTVAVPYVKQRNEAEKRAVTDELTGLLNRRGFMERARAILASPHFNPKRYILMYFDLNGFKAVNDTHGHAAGDKVLNHVGNRLSLRKTDVVARLGGDEFAVLADTEAEIPDRRGLRRLRNPRRTPKTREESIKGITDHLVEQVQQGGVDAGYLGISASVGIQDLNNEYDLQEIIEKADHAMQAHKAITGSGR